MITNYIEIIKHVNNCCITHGCKFNSDDCPVVSAKYSQNGLCDTCEKMVPRIAKIIEELDARR